MAIDFNHTILSAHDSKASAIFLGGRSQSQPFCDGSHEGSGIEPMEWKVERDRRALLCTCKQTKKPPICDNTHLTLR